MDKGDKQGMADFWGVSLRTVQRWIAKGMRPWSIEWMRTYFLSERAPDPVRAKLEKIADSTPSSFGGLDVGDVDIDEDPKSDLDGLIRYRAYYKAKLDRAIASEIKEDIKYWSDLYQRTTEGVRKARLLADRLGLDMGQTVGRESVERWLVAHCWQLLRCIDANVADLSKRLTGLDYPEEIVRVLEPTLLSAVFFMPLLEAGAKSSGMDLPDWWRGAVESAAREFVVAEDLELLEGAGI